MEKLNEIIKDYTMDQLVAVYNLSKNRKAETSPSMEQTKAILAVIPKTHSTMVLNALMIRKQEIDLAAKKEQTEEVGVVEETDDEVDEQVEQTEEVEVVEGTDDEADEQVEQVEEVEPDDEEEGQVEEAEEVEPDDEEEGAAQSEEIKSVPTTSDE